MSAFPGYLSHFVDWLRSRSEFYEVSDSDLREMFVPRMVYGDYIRSLADTHLRPVTTAVPELRGQAMRVAQVTLDQMPTSIEEEHAIEYCI